MNALRSSLESPPAATVGSGDFFATLAFSELVFRTPQTERLVAFYREGVGLHPASLGAGGSHGQVALAAEAGGPALVVLERARDESPAPAPGGGLFHVAFLFPDRARLAGAVKRLATEGFLPSGAADHGVSEAIYYSDPDGNGVELYADRAPDRWPRQGEEVAMVTSSLDLDALLTSSPEGSQPAGSAAPVRIGHLHFTVTDLEPARRFICDELGLRVRQSTYPGALFLAERGYHHHIAINRWGAGRNPPPQRRGGLVSFRMRRPGPAGPDFRVSSRFILAGFAPHPAAREVRFVRT